MTRREFADSEGLAVLRTAKLITQGRLDLLFDDDYVYYQDGILLRIDNITDEELFRPDWYELYYLGSIEEIK